MKLSLAVVGPDAAETGSDVDLVVTLRNDGPDAADRWGVFLATRPGLEISSVDHEVGCEDLQDCEDDPLLPGEEVVLTVAARADAACVDEGGPRPRCLWLDDYPGSGCLVQNFVHTLCAGLAPPPYEVTEFWFSVAAYAEAIDGNTVPEEDWQQPVPDSPNDSESLFAWNVHQVHTMELIPIDVRLPDAGTNAAQAIAVALMLLALGGIAVRRGRMVLSGRGLAT